MSSPTGCRYSDLAGSARSHKVLEHTAHVREVEITPETVQRPLDPLVAVCVYGRDHLHEQRQGGWDVQAATERHHVVKQRPRRRTGPGSQLVAYHDQSGVLRLSLPKLVNEVETRSQHRQHGPVLCVAPGRGISHSVCSARLVLDREVETEKLPDPMVLWDGCKPLVEEILEAEVVGAHHEAASPQVWTPMADGEDEADQLSLIRGEGLVARCDGPAKEGEWVLVLDQHRAEPVRRSVAFDDETIW